MGQRRGARWLAAMLFAAAAWPSGSLAPRRKKPSTPVPDRGRGHEPHPLRGHARRPLALPGLGRAAGSGSSARPPGDTPRRRWGPRGRSCPWVRRCGWPATGALRLGRLRRDLEAALSTARPSAACCPRAIRSRTHRLRWGPLPASCAPTTRARRSGPPSLAGVAGVAGSSGRGRRWSLATEPRRARLRGRRTDLHATLGRACRGRTSRPSRCRRSSPWTPCSSRRRRAAASTAPVDAGRTWTAAGLAGRERGRPRLARAVPLRRGRRRRLPQRRRGRRPGRRSSDGLRQGRPARLMFPLAPAAGLEAFVGTDRRHLPHDRRRPALVPAVGLAGEDVLTAGHLPAAGRPPRKEGASR